jgi:uncharacterized protein (DUF983 family)
MVAEKATGPLARIAGQETPEISSFRSGLTFKCPNCGKGKLYSGYLKIAGNCGNCGVKLGELDPGDGPAVFVMLVVGFAVVGLALVVEVKYSPPFWMHMALWMPLILGGSLSILPLLKSMMFTAQYRTRAGEDMKIGDDKS